MKILILGSEGFIGKNLRYLLHNYDHKVHCISRRQGYDLREKAQMNEIIKSNVPDVVFNLASHGGGVQYIRKHGSQIILDNTLMSLNLYKAISEYSPHTKIVNALSNCSYPGHLEILEESQWLSGEVHDSVLAYGNSKRYLYNLSKIFFLEKNIHSINFLFPGAFGPNDYVDPSKTKALDGMIIRMIEAQKNQAGAFSIWGTGKPIREWIYVKDFVLILLEALNIEKEIIYPVNIAQNRGYSIKDTANFIAKYSEYKGKILFDTSFPDGAKKKIMSDNLFKSMFPKFEYTKHENGIAETVKYYQKVLK